VRADSNFEAGGAFGHRYPQPPFEHEFQIRTPKMLAELESASEFLNDTSDQTTRLTKILSKSNYHPIEWQSDIKSGYRWDANGWWLDQQIGSMPGADIKVPWEISRAHDLVDFAIAAYVNSSVATADLIALRLLDWIIANPARRGVNWRSTMEVAIRASNWIWALAISEMTMPLSPSIHWIVARSLEQHAQFIVQYPDDRGPGANNHYIADMAGLAHISAALPSHEDASNWGEIAATGLSEQANLAVNADGFSYEGSVGYHRLITELLTHGTLSTMRFPSSWPASHVIDYPNQWRILTGMFEAANALQKPNGRSPQFGDHDAGRFFKFHRPLTPSGEEDPLDHSHLQLLIDGIKGESTNPIEQLDPEFVLPTLGIHEEKLAAVRDALNNQVDRTVKNPLQLGAWVAQTGRLWVAIRTFNADPSAPTSHLHDDALSVELCVDGQDVLVDPGTGVYTADPSIRNNLRDRLQHSTAGPSNNVESESPEIFKLNGIGTVHVQHADAGSFSATYETDDWALNRTAEITESCLLIKDTFDGVQPWRQVFVFHPDVSVSAVDSPGEFRVKVAWPNSEITLQFDNTAQSTFFDKASYSPQYGAVVPTSRLIVERSAPCSSQLVIEFT
jgi:hypothetical protein